MVYLDNVTSLRYIILVQNPQYLNIGNAEAKRSQYLCILAEKVVEVSISLKKNQERN